MSRSVMGGPSAMGRVIGFIGPIAAVLLCLSAQAGAQPLPDAIPTPRSVPEAAPPEPLPPTEVQTPPAATAPPPVPARGPTIADAIVSVMAIAAAGIILHRRLYRPVLSISAHPSPAAPLAPPSTMEAALVLLVGAMAVWLAQGLGAISAKAIVGLGPADVHTVRGIALLLLGGVIGAAAGTWAIAAAIPWIRHTLGLLPDRRSIIAGLSGSLLIIPLVVAVSAMTVVVIQWAGGKAPDPIAHDTLRAIAQGPRGGSAHWWWLATIALVLGIPAVEELIYRGLVQSAIRVGAGSSWMAIAATSVLFAIAHAGIVTPEALPTLLVLSVGLGILYERTGRLAAPILVHAAFNAANIALAVWGR